MSKGIEKIDLCDNCYNKKAEYFFYKRNLIGIFMRLLCKDCAKQQAIRERLDIA